MCEDICTCITGTINALLGSLVAVIIDVLALVIAFVVGGLVVVLVAVIAVFIAIISVFGAMITTVCFVIGSILEAALGPMTGMTFLEIASTNDALEENQPGQKKLSHIEIRINEKSYVVA